MPALPLVGRGNQTFAIQSVCSVCNKQSMFPIAPATPNFLGWTEGPEESMHRPCIAPAICSHMRVQRNGVRPVCTNGRHCTACDADHGCRRHPALLEPPYSTRGGVQEREPQRVCAATTRVGSCKSWRWGFSRNGHDRSERSAMSFGA
jgi:hypothetical protein